MNSKEARFLALLEAHKGILLKISRLYQDREEDRQDLLQEMMLQLWSSFDLFRGESQFSSWMYRVALNTAITFFKKEKKRAGLQKLTGYENLPDELQAVAAKEEQLAILYRAAERLNKLEKALLFLYLEGRSGQEIADILAISPVSARVRVNRVKEKLKYIIKTMGYEF